MLTIGKIAVKRNVGRRKKYSATSRRGQELRAVELFDLALYKDKVQELVVNPQ